MVTAVPGQLDTWTDYRQNPAPPRHECRGIFRAAKTAETVSNEPVRWIFAAVMTVVILALVRTFIGNARALKQDMDQRFEALQARLERDANSLADELLSRTPDQSQE
jgi:hypothetical protein